MLELTLEGREWRGHGTTFVMVDISLVWINQSWKVFDASRFAGYENSGDRNRDRPSSHGQTAAKSAKTQCPRGIPRPNGSRGRSLALHDHYYDKHPWMYPKELHFLGANVRGKKRTQLQSLVRTQLE